MYRFDIYYFMQESIEPIVLEEHQIQVLGDPPPPSHVHVCFAFYEKIIFRPFCICLVFFVLSDIDIFYFMHESIEPMVLKDHQI